MTSKETNQMAKVRVKCYYYDTKTELNVYPILQKKIEIPKRIKNNKILKKYVAKILKINKNEIHMHYSNNHNGLETQSTFNRDRFELFQELFIGKIMNVKIRYYFDNNKYNIYKYSLSGCQKNIHQTGKNAAKVVVSVVHNMLILLVV